MISALKEIAIIMFWLILISILFAVVCSVLYALIDTIIQNHKKKKLLKLIIKTALENTKEEKK